MCVCVPMCRRSLFFLILFGPSNGIVRDDDINERERPATVATNTITDFFNRSAPFDILIGEEFSTFQRFPPFTRTSFVVSCESCTCLARALICTHVLLASSSSRSHSEREIYAYLIGFHKMACVRLRNIACTRDSQHYMFVFHFSSDCGTPPPPSPPFDRVSAN